MSMAEFRARIGEAADQVGNKGPPRHGLVTSYDPNTYSVKLQIMPPPAEGEAAETNWMPILSAWVGPGWGLAFGPTIGDLMLIVYPEGDDQGGVAIGANFNEVDTPMPVPSGEAWLVHGGGASIKLTSDGQITTVGPWVHTGDLTVTGTVTGTTDVIAAGKSGAHHIHGGVQGGASNTSPPT